MGSLRPPARVKLFCAILYSPGFCIDEGEQVLQRHFGPVTLRSQTFRFTQTTYYNREMGEDLQRCYIAFAPLIGMAELATIKHTTNRLETRWAGRSGQRQVNLDPGYLDLAKVVLATTKDHAHRLYIGGGIYAEVTLRYRCRRFQPWEWTYPDYRLPITLTFFGQLRQQYKTQLYPPTLA